jgi:hypothetical protein
MKKLQLIAAALVLAALIAGLYWSNHQQPIEEAAKIAANAPIKILSVGEGDFTNIEIKKKDGDDVVLSKIGPTSWKITSPRTLDADKDQVSDLLDTLSSVSADRVIEEKAADLKPYGLADPAIKISYVLNGGNPQNLLIGDDTPAGSSAYATLASDSRVFTITSTKKAAFDKSLKDLRDKRLLPIDIATAHSVDVTGPKLNLTIGSRKGQWVVQNPKDVRGDTAKLEFLMEQIRTTKMDPALSDVEMKKAGAAFASGTPVGSVKVADPSGNKRELRVRKSENSYYAQSTTMEGTYKVLSDLGETLGRDLDFFRDKKLFDFGDDNPNKIELYAGPKYYVLTRSGDDWWSAGRKMDAVSVDAFLHGIRVLAAPKFVTAGFSNPTLNLTVTSRDGSRIEKVQFVKSGDNYLAKREDGSLLYELDATAVEDLLKSADDMKPAEPAKK